MWFDATLESAWEEGLRLGVADAGCEAIRVDRIHHNDKICDRIVSEIHRCGFLIADVTGHRQGVYFEAGLALGLGKPVIWTCRKDAFDDAHFDTRQYNHIVWETPADLRGMLRDRIRATILPSLAVRPE
jgi:nucleoside 2-deoxyribosyltransferase